MTRPGKPLETGKVTGTITGTFAGPGVVCPQFRLESGETISLSGAVPDGPPGTRASLQGMWREASKCQQGREFRVQGAE